MSLFQLIFTNVWLLKNLQSWKTSSHVIKTTLSRSYTDKTLLLAYWNFFRNFISERASNTQQLLLIYTELIIFLNPWIKFPLYNRQP